MELKFMKILMPCLFFILAFSLYSLPGDVDNNGSVMIVDALRIARYSVGFRESPFNSSVADVNNDGRINIVDALLVAQYYTGIIPYFAISTYKKLSVPTVLQNPNMCGAASGLMYLAFQKDVYRGTGLTLPSQTDIYNQMRISDPPGGVGVTFKGLLITLNSLLYKYAGVDTTAFTMPYIKSNSTAGDGIPFLMQLALINEYQPSIVLWYGSTIDHYVVMVGYDHNTDEILYNEPATGKSNRMKMDLWIANSYIPVTKERLFISKSM